MGRKGGIRELGRRTIQMRNKNGARHVESLGKSDTKNIFPAWTLQME